MSKSPIISDKAGAQIMEMIRPAVPSLDKLTPTARLKQAIIQEPSPASTHGDSATDSSNPVTPQDGAVRDLTSNLSNLLATQVDVSPGSKLVRGSNCLMLDERESHELIAQPSPSRSVKDQIAHRSGSIHSSPDTDRLNTIRNSPTWCGPQNRNFVRSSGNKDDPFVADSPATQSSSKDSAGTVYHVREDRAGAPPTPGTAQAHFSPDACVFVANLLQTATDQQLEHAVTASFSHFGKVYVKIRRDSRGMPFAFAQYETEGEAQHAVTEGRNIPILGRHCRTEIAKVNRTLYLSRIAGGDIAHEEARQVLKEYGAIEELHYASPTDRALYGLPQGIFVRFHFYDDCRDAQIKFRVHDDYRLEQARVPEDMRSSMFSRSASHRSLPFAAMGFSNMTPGRSSPRSPTIMGLRYDDCSIFVGNLPPDVSELRVQEHFASFGRILSVVVCPKPFSMYSMVATAFAFVEYSARGEAVIAVQHASRLFEGFQLRIEHKVPKRLPTSHGGSPTSIHHSEKNRMHAQTQDMLMMLYHRGFEVGMSQAAQAQAMVTQVIPPPVYASYPQQYYPQYDSNLGMYGGPNGASPNYGLGSQSCYNSSIASAIGQAQYAQGTVATPYLQYEQAHGYTQPPLVRDGELPYTWPLPSSDNRPSSSANTH